MRWRSRRGRRNYLKESPPRDECRGSTAHQTFSGANIEDLPLQHVAGNLHTQRGVLEDGRHEYSVHTGLLYSQDVVSLLQKMKVLT